MARQLIKLLPKNFRAITARLMVDLDMAKVYLVGGAVRDLILARPTKDYDLVVGGVEAAALEHWLMEHGQVNLVGKTFGVFKWQPAGWAGEAIDVALPRTEHVSLGSGRYRDFTVQSNPDLPIEDDLSRRDFTINALAIDLASGVIVDPSHGQADIEAKRIKTVGKPEVRFKEDLSRVLRAVRQACQLGFRIEAATLRGVVALSSIASNGQKAGDWLVPREIVARELLKALATNPIMALGLFDKTGFLAELMPEIHALKGVPQPPEFHSEGDVFEHTKLALEAFVTPEWREFFGDVRPSLNVIIATLLHDIGKPLTLMTPEKHGVNRIRTDGHDVAGAKIVPEICQRLRLSSYIDPARGQINVETVTWLVQNHLILGHGSPEIFKPATVYRYFLKDPSQGLELQQVIFADMHATRPEDGRRLTPKLKQLQERLGEVNKKLTAGKLKLLLSGEDIMASFKIKPGPAVGRLLKLLEEAQLAGSVKTKRQAVNHLKKQL